MASTDKGMERKRGRPRFTLLALIVMVNVGGLLAWFNMGLWEFMANFPHSMFVRVILSGFSLAASLSLMGLSGIAVTWAQGITAARAAFDEGLRQTVERAEKKQDRPNTPIDPPTV